MQERAGDAVKPPGLIERNIERPDRNACHCSPGCLRHRFSLVSVNHRRHAAAASATGFARDMGGEGGVEAVGDQHKLLPAGLQARILDLDAACQALELLWFQPGVGLNGCVMPCLRPVFEVRHLSVAYKSHRRIVTYTQLTQTRQRQTIRAMETAPANGTTGSARQVLAQNLKRLRAARGWSQEQLAFEAGLHRTFVAHVEREVRNISLDNVERLAMALGVSPAALLTPTTNG